MGGFGTLSYTNSTFVWMIPGFPKAKAKRNSTGTRFEERDRHAHSLCEHVVRL